MSKSLGLLLLRVGTAAMMIGAHGLAKVNKYDQLSGSFPDPLGVGSEASLLLAILAEGVFTLLLAVGLITRPSALILLVNMLVAALVVHGDDPFARKELALLYALPALTLLFTGAGKFSLDALLYPQFRRSWLGRWLRP